MTGSGAELNGSVNTLARSVEGVSHILVVEHDDFVVEDEGLVLTYREGNVNHVVLVCCQDVVVGIFLSCIVTILVNNFHESRDGEGLAVEDNRYFVVVAGDALHVERAVLTFVEIEGYFDVLVLVAFVEILEVEIPLTNEVGLVHGVFLALYEGHALGQAGFGVPSAYEELYILGSGQGVDAFIVYVDIHGEGCAAFPCFVVHPHIVGDVVLLVVFGIVEGYGLGSLVVVTYVAGINFHVTVITGSAVGRRADEAGHEHSAAFVHLDVTLEGAGDVARVDIIALVVVHRHGVDTGECSRCGVECRLYEDLLGRSTIEHPDGAVGILEVEVFGVQRESLLAVHHELYITT